MKNFLFSSKSCAVAASIIVSLTANSSNAQDTISDSNSAKPSLNRLEAFRSSQGAAASQSGRAESIVPPVETGQIGSSVPRSGVISSISDSVVSGLSSPQANGQPSTTTGPHPINGTLGFQAISSYRGGTTNPVSTRGVGAPVPVQFSDLGQYRSLGIGHHAPLQVSLPPTFSTGGSLVSAAPISNFRRVIQDTGSTASANKFHADLQGLGFSAERLRGANLQASTRLSGAELASDESRLVFIDNSKTWSSPDLFWQPLYFEDPAAERYGHHAGVFQPSISAVRFLRDTVFLPYKFSAHPPYECDFGLGFDRPGNCVEPRRELPEISGRGLLGQGAAVTGLIFLF